MYCKGKAFILFFSWTSNDSQVSLSSNCCYIRTRTNTEAEITNKQVKGR